MSSCRLLGIHFAYSGLDRIYAVETRIGEQHRDQAGCHLHDAGRRARKNVSPWRLDAVMSMGPTLQQLYDSLDDKQKMGLSRAVRRSGLAGKRS
jgi:hypothetical protein